MKSFPKKYNPKDLSNRSKTYREKNSVKKEESSVVFSTTILSGSKKISYRDFFFFYLKEFHNYKLSVEDSQNFENLKNDKYEQLFLACGNQLQDISACYDFFSKRNQTLLQVWSDKLERRVKSSTKKYLNVNHKILENYTSSNYKIYMPDSDLYIYILQQIRGLREKWKIINKTEIWYRSFNLQTSIPLEKILRKEEKVPYYVLKYFIWTKWEALYVRVDGDIDMCCGDVALLVHPKDKRYNKYIWKKAIIPLCNRLIPIIGDETVNIAENDWIKRVCPCAEEESIKLAQKYGLSTDIYVFDKQWLYTEYIHEKAFIWKERNKYYNNILEFIGDIGNMADSWEEMWKQPYLYETGERLIPYKMDQIILDLKEEKEKIINELLQHNINYPSLNTEIMEYIEGYDFSEELNIDDFGDGVIDEDNMENGESIDDKKNDKIKQKIIEEVDSYLPDSIVCNSQIPFWWRFPLIFDSKWELSFFDIENDCLKWKQKPLQLCFDFVLLSLMRAWAIRVKESWNGDNKICEHEKFYIKFLENEKKVEYLVQYLSKITWEKSEYEDFMKIIENLGDENSSTLKEFLNLVKNSKYLSIEWIWLYTNVKGIISDTIDSDFVELCIPCYLKNKWININSLTIFNGKEKRKIFKELLIQELLLGDTITKTLLEYLYDEKNEFLWDKQMSKLQLEQAQWEIFSIYWENPIRLSLLINQTFDQKEILLNNIFLKQIWNAVRLCIQKGFLPENIKECLSKFPKDFEDFDICLLEKIKELNEEWLDIKTYEQYTKFFNSFKESIQNTFFSWYLEILKVHPTKNVQFVCSYFFNFILTILYPSIPEFVDALQYVSQRDFMFKVDTIELDKTTDYNMNILYTTFIKIKQLKIESNIKQHETCNVFIKSTPTIWDIFVENEQIFKNYFHISDINYFRLHEANPLWYEIMYSDKDVTIWIQPWNSQDIKEKDSLESLERDIKNLEDKLILLRQRIQILPEWEQREKTEEEYSKTKEEMENLTIKYSLLSSK